MSSDRASLEDITGYLGVGGLELLGLFLIVDGLSGFLTFVETYSKTNSWTILVTVPILVISYVLGLISSLAVESVLSFKPVLTPELFVEVTSSKNELLIRRFSEVERHSRLLNGCFIAFLILSCGSIAEVRMMGTFGFVGYIGFYFSIGFAVICPIIARHQQRNFLPYIKAITNVAQNDTNQGLRN